MSPAAILTPSSPRLPPFWLVVLVAVLGPFSFHIVIPALPLLVSEFGIEFDAAQRTLTAYLIGISGGQLIYGPLSDRFGRRPVLLGGVALYLVASLACATAQSIEALIALRLLQGATGCAGHVLSRAIIRDCYPRDRAASLMGYATMTMASCASFSPLIAALIQERWGWRMNFYLLSGVSAFALLCALRWLNETKLDRLEGQGPARLFGNYVMLLRSPAYLAYALSSAFAMSAWYGFVAGAPYVLTRLLGQPPIAYGKYILIVLAGYVAGNFVAGRFSVRWGGARMITVGQTLAMIGVAIQLVLLFTVTLTPLVLFLPMALIIFASGLFLPNANAGALSTHPQLAGSASGLSGFLQMGFSALATVVLGSALSDSEAPLIALTVGTSVLSALSMLLLRVGRARSTAGS